MDEQHKELKKELRNLSELVTQVRIDIAMLKVRAGLWGAAAGAVPVFLAGLFSLYNKK